MAHSKIDQQMTLTYVSPYAESMTGISAKLQSQLDALKIQYHTRCFHIVPMTENVPDRTIGRLFNECISGLVLSWSSSIYYRYCPLNALLNLQISILSRFKTVWVEMNTCYEEELKQEHPIHMALHRTSMKFLRNSNCTFLPVTGEIARLESLPTDRFRVLPNGCNSPAPSTNLPGDTSSSVANELNAQRNSGKRVLLFAASKICLWHGFDRIIELVEKLDNVFLAVIGDVGEHESDLAHLVEQNKAGSYGSIPEREMRHVYQACDFGLGSFGLDRIHLTEACPLKTRGYLAAGLRVIANYRDTVLNESWATNHFFQIEGDDISGVQDFIESDYDRRALSTEAESKLSWSEAFKKVGVLKTS